jgi:excisionase family DNA binding protein
MYPAYVREKARQLRLERRMSIDEIAERLALSRSTVYYWVRDLPIPGSGSGGGWPATAQRKGSMAMQAKYRRLREDAYEEGRAGFAMLAASPTFRDFICMYIGEGYKRNRDVVALCNSDPAVVALGDRWIKRFASNPVRYALQYHADQDLALVTAFWAQLVGCRPEDVRLQRKSNSNGLAGRSWRSVHGVLTVHTGDTLLRARLQAWMDCVRESWV